MDAHDITEILKRELEKNRTRGAHIARLLEAHDIPIDGATVIGLIFNGFAIARELGIPDGLLAILCLDVLDVPHRIVDAKTHMAPDDVAMLRHQLNNMPGHAH